MSNVYGKTNADGTQTQPDVCILTGRKVTIENSVRESVSGTPYFYRVAHSQYHRVTDDLRAQWAKNVPVEKVERASKAVVKVEENNS